MKQSLAILLVCAATAAIAIEPVVFDDPALERRYRELIAEIRCLVCQNQTLADSNAPLAVDLRGEVKRMLDAGASDDEIVTFLTARYGNFVLYRPPLDATTVALWFGPVLFLAVGGWAGWRVMRARHARRMAEATEDDRRRVRELFMRGEAPSAGFAVLLDRYRELEDDRVGGTLDDERYEQAVSELEAAAVAELAPPVADSSRRGAWVPAVAFITIPVFAGAMYLAISEPADRSTELADLVVDLAERMKERPDDAQGWMLLGRSRVVLGDYAGAIVAWREALRIVPDDPAVMTNLAEAIVLENADRLEHEAALLLDRALALDDSNPKALWYGGLLAQARGDAAHAREYWSRLRAMDPPEQFRVILERRLAMLDDGTAAATGLVTVLVAPALAGSVPASATLFVTVQDPTGGPPLAAVRSVVANWPTTVSIDPGAAMLSGAELPDGELELVARVSISGVAGRRPGDLIGRVRWRAGTAVTITIDRVVGQGEGDAGR